MKAYTSPLLISVLGLLLCGCLHTRIEHTPKYPDADRAREPMLLSFEGTHSRFGQIEKTKKSPGVITVAVNKVGVQDNGQGTLQTTPEFLCRGAEFIHRDKVVHVKRRLNKAGKWILTTGALSLAVGGVWAGISGADYAKLPPPSPVAGPDERRQDSTKQLVIPLTIVGVGAAMTAWPALELISTNEYFPTRARMELTGKLSACKAGPLKKRWAVKLSQRQRGTRMASHDFQFNGRTLAFPKPILIPLPRSVDHDDLFLEPVSCLSITPSVGESVRWGKLEHSRVSGNKERLCFRWSSHPKSERLVKAWRLERTERFVTTRLVSNTGKLIARLKGAANKQQCDSNVDLYCNRPWAEQSAVVAALDAWALQAYSKQKRPKDQGYPGEGALRQISWNHANGADKKTKVSKLAWFLRLFPSPTGTYYTDADDQLWELSKSNSARIKAYRSLLPRGRHASKTTDALAAALIKEKDLETFLVELTGHPKWSGVRKKFLGQLSKRVAAKLRKKNFDDAREVVEEGESTLGDDDKALVALSNRIDKAEKAEERRVAAAEAARERREAAKERAQQRRAAKRCYSACRRISDWSPKICRSARVRSSTWGFNNCRKWRYTKSACKSQCY